MQSYGQHQYNQINVSTADRSKLVVLLYEGAINFLKKAKQGELEGDFEAKCNNINRAHAIIQELNNSLKVDENNEIGGNLRSLYYFMEKHLVMAKIKKDGSEKLEEVISLLNRLYEAWVAVSKNPEVKQILPTQTSIHPGLSRGISA